MTYLNDVVGHVVFHKGKQFDQRKGLRFSGPGVRAEDDPGTSATRIIGVAPQYNDLAQNFNGRTGDVVAEYADYPAVYIVTDVRDGVQEIRLGDELERIYDASYNAQSFARGTLTPKAFADAHEVTSEDFGKRLVPLTPSAQSIVLTDSGGWEDGSWFDVMQTGSSPITISAGPGTVIEIRNFALQQTSGQWSAVRLYRKSPGVWNMSGEVQVNSPRWEGSLKPVATAFGEAFEVEETKSVGGFVTDASDGRITPPPYQALYKVTYSLLFEAQVIGAEIISDTWRGQRRTESSYDTAEFSRTFVHLYTPGDTAFSVYADSPDGLTPRAGAGECNVSIEWLGDFTGV